MSTEQKDLARLAAISNTHACILRAKRASDELNAAIASLCGFMMSKTDTNDVSLTDDTDTVFMDPRNDSIDVSTVDAIQYDEDGVLIVVDSEGLSTPILDLMLEARLALAEKLVKMLEA